MDCASPLALLTAGCVDDGLKYDCLWTAAPTKAVEDYRSPRRYREAAAVFKTLRLGHRPIHFPTGNASGGRSPEAAGFFRQNTPRPQSSKIE